MKPIAKQSIKKTIISSLLILLGSFITAFSLEIFLIPNKIIDGGVIGVSILISKFFDNQTIKYPLIVLLNIPFMYLASKNLGKSLLFQMIVALVSLSIFGPLIEHSGFQVYRGDLLEIVAIGGALLGFGVGLVIRVGGCIDGTEILGLLMNKKYGVSVGNVVLSINAVIFLVSAIVFRSWRPAIDSLITFFVVIKVMDMVIMGIDEMKSIMIFSSKPKTIANSLMHDMGLGLTFIEGRGGFTGEPKLILFLMAERLQLSSIKSIVHAEDSEAFIAIENLHEVASNNLKGITNKLSKLD